MECTVCSVISVKGSWFADCGTTRHGPYMSNGIALRVATGEALALYRKQLPARVSVQDDAGCVCAEWLCVPNIRFGMDAGNGRGKLAA